MKVKDGKTSGDGEGKRAYQRPEIMSMSSTDLLELLGPAHGYGRTPGTGTGSGVSGNPSTFGFDKG